MKQHEIEALRGFVAQWREHLRRREADGLSNKSIRISECADMLEDFINSIPAPDDGLSELVENLKQHAAKKEEIRDGILWAIGYVEEFFELERLALEEKKQNDDGLREGLEELKRKWRGVVYGLNEEKREDAAAEVAGCVFEIETLLTNIPNGWKPIADAPRDGQWLLFGNERSAAVCEMFRWIRDNNRWQSKTGSLWEGTELRFTNLFTHFRPLPAPPREGKG